MPRLFHVSDRSNIAIFHPRPRTAPPDAADPVVWAIDADHLANQLLPRDCPRVCVRADARSTVADVGRLLSGDRTLRMIAVESGWMPVIRLASLVVYEMPRELFVLDDELAGYWVTRRAVSPIGVEVVSDVPARLEAEGIWLTDRESLWSLRDAVVASTLVFSIMRMRNAAPRRVSP